MSNVSHLFMQYKTATTIELKAKAFGASLSVTLDITQSGANGLDAGTEEADTFYNVFVISGTSGVAGLLSKSNPPTGSGYDAFELDPAPVSLPSGYDAYEWVGAVKNNTNGNLDEFIQWDRFVDCPQNSVLSKQDETNFATFDLSKVVPPSAKAVLLQQVYWKKSGTGNVCVTLTESGTGTTAGNSSRTTCTPDSSSIWNRGIMPYINLSGPQELSYRVSSGGECSINIAGWRY